MCTEKFLRGEPHTLVADIVQTGVAAAQGPWKDIITQMSFQDARSTDSWHALKRFGGLALRRCEFSAFRRPLGQSIVIRIHIEA